MIITVDRCGSAESGGPLAVCDGASGCDAGLTCSMENTNVWGLCKLNYDERCVRDEQCSSGICNSYVNKCDILEPEEFGALCSSDEHCGDSYSCGNEGTCVYDGDYVLVLNKISATGVMHQNYAAACGGYLASVSDAAEDATIEDILLRNGAYSAFIGLEAPRGEGWSWMDGSDSSYRNWQSSYWGQASDSKSLFVRAYLFGGNTIVWQKQATSSWYYGVYRLPENYAEYDGCVTSNFEL